MVTATTKGKGANKTKRKKSVPKDIVLDTNVLVHKPTAMFDFGDNRVHVPIKVVQELDRFKKESTERGKAAREVSRILDALRATGKLSDGVPLENGGMLRTVLFHLNPELNLFDLDLDEPDDLILATALTIQYENSKGKAADKKRQVVMVSKDTNVRIKADALGLIAEDFKNDKISISELYTGISQIYLPCAGIDNFYQSNLLDIETAHVPNEYLVMTDETNFKHTALGRYNAALKRIEPLLRVQPARNGSGGVWGLSPRNCGQSFVLDALMDDEIKIVTIIGTAGTGKTLLAIAAGLEKVMEENVYSRLLVSRPVIPLGRDLGFLPGEIKDKLAPWMQPIYDNLEMLLALDDEHGQEKGGDSSPKGRKSQGYRELEAMGVLEVEPLTYIRGRSIPNQYLIVDEAQNLTPHEAKTIITRAGEGTKIILTGDPFQIDNPYVDSESNGLTHVVNRMKNEKISAHITLTEGVRSELATLAANLL